MGMPEGSLRNESLCAEPPTLDSTLIHTCRQDTYTSLPQDRVRCKVLAQKVVVTVYKRPLISYENAQDRDETHCTRISCDDDFESAWLPAGQYRIILRGYNPPETPPVDADNVWTLTIGREVRSLGGGSRSVVEPLYSAQVPGYRIGAGAEYSDRISPMGGHTLRGGAQWQESGGLDYVATLQ